MVETIIFTVSRALPGLFFGLDRVGRDLLPVPAGTASLFRVLTKIWAARSDSVTESRVPVREPASGTLYVNVRQSALLRVSYNTSLRNS